MRHMRRLGKQYFIRFLPLAWIITMLIGLGYIIVQQTIRTQANDQLVQQATDLSSALSVGEDPAPLIPQRSIDIGLSLTPFVITYDETGKVTNSNVITASPDGIAPPKGVFDYARSHIDNRITWQPEPNIRTAIVVQHYTSNDSSGFVLVGRNLRETERLEDYILKLAAAAWLVTIVGTFGLIILTEEAKLRV